MANADARTSTPRVRYAARSSWSVAASEVAVGIGSRWRIKNCAEKQRHVTRVARRRRAHIRAGRYGSDLVERKRVELLANSHQQILPAVEHVGLRRRGNVADVR